MNDQEVKISLTMMKASIGYGRLAEAQSVNSSRPIDQRSILS